jgi:hypothetical protein
VHALGELIGETLRDQGGEEFSQTGRGDRQAAIRRARAMPRRPILQARTAGLAVRRHRLTRAFSIWFRR